jgi:AraC-like DNA-binding protein
MNYREYVPVERLTPFVECLWTLEGHARSLGGEAQPVLPDGRTELVVHFGDPFERIEGGVVERQPSVLFAGQLAHRLLLRPTGCISVLGVRFRPHGAAAFIREPQGRLIGLTIDAANVSADLGLTGRHVREQAQSLNAAVKLIQKCLIERLPPPSTDARVARAVAAIDRGDGLIGIEDLAASLDTTRRHLERLFQQQVGMSPKRLARITRFQRAVRVLDGAGSPTGTLAAHACGYADQAHFIREFRELAGCSPGRHLLDRAELTGFFSSAGTPGSKQEEF